MNVFALDPDPEIAAQSHCDKHVNKMLLESVQILNGALYERDLDDFAFYGYTHKNHPCTLWAAESWANFEWLIKLTHHLNKEWQFRFDHEKNHTSYQKMIDNWWDRGSWNLPAEADSRTPFALAMAEDVKSFDRVQAYRDYYRQYKQPQDWFTFERGRAPPEWL
jgi:hypothetical protein